MQPLSLFQALVGTAALTGTVLGAAVPQDGGALWQPAVGSSYQIILTNALTLGSGAPSPDVDIYDLDLFDTDASIISALHAKGKKVICYFSAGTSEDWRPDWSQIPEQDKGACLPAWAGERWLNVHSDAVWSVMANRISLAAQKGCDAIDPDNMDGYSNDNAGGIGLTTGDSVTYLKKLAAEAAKYGMSTGLKNAQEILPEVSGSVQFAVNEQCAANSGDCASYSSFGKPVYHIEYSNSHSVSDSERARLCLASGDGSAGDNAYTFTTVIKELSLDGWVMYCDGTSYTSPTTETGEHKGGSDCTSTSSRRSVGLAF